MLKIYTGKIAPHFGYLAHSYIHQTIKELYTLDKKNPNIALFQRGQTIKKLTVPTGYWSIDSRKDSFEHIFKNVILFVDCYDVFLKLKQQRETYYLPLAVDTRLFKPMNCYNETFDIGFVGLLKGHSYAPRRFEFLNILEKYFKCKIYDTGQKKEKALTIKELIRFYSNCKLIFNYSGVSGLNMRIFEALAMKKVVITNRIGREPEILFKNWKELVIYSNLNDLIEKVKYLLENESLRKQIAGNGFKAVQTHTWINRIKKAVSILVKYK